MIFGKYINKYYLKNAPILILGLAALILVDYFQLFIPELYRMVINGMNGDPVLVNGQKDPVVEYRIEGFDMFDQMVDSIRESSIKMLLTIEVREAGAAPKREQVAKPTGEGYVPGNGAPGAKGAPKGQPVRVIKIGRNDPCPCGSGLKWKKCTCAKYHPEGTSTNEN